MKTHCEWIKSTQDHRSSITESSTGQNSQNRIISKPRKKESHHHSSKNKSSEKHKPKHKHRKEKR